MNLNKIKINLREAIASMSDSFALEDARNSLIYALNKIEHVESKKVKQEVIHNNLKFVPNYGMAKVASSEMKFVPNYGMINPNTINLIDKMIKEEELKLSKIEVETENKLIKD